MKTVKRFRLKIVIFTAVKNRCMLHGRVFVMIDVEDVRHYDNTPMQIYCVFHGCKKGNFQLKDCDIFSYFCSKT